MKTSDLEKHLSHFKGAEASFPFGPEALVFKVMNKMFALLSQNETVPRLTLKSAPDDAVMLVDQYESVTPGYYMNKKHWITIELTGELSDKKLHQLTEVSYELVVKKLTKVEKAKLEAK